MPAERASMQCVREILRLKLLFGVQISTPIDKECRDGILPLPRSTHPLELGRMGFLR